MRLEEGFNFAHSSAGIVTMAIELSMDSNSSCTVQYVLFPPHSSWWGEGDAHSGSDDDGDVEPEIDCELQMVTEVWIEPQNGRVSTTSPRLNYMNNKAYYEIAEEVRTLDLRCITSLLTLEHLSLKCQDKKTRPLESAIPTYRSQKHHSSLGSKSCKFNFDYLYANLDAKAIWNPLFVHRIQHIPFQFDLINILPLCHQTELLFSMFIENTIKLCCHTDKSNKVLMENVHNHLQYLHDYKLELTVEESTKFTDQVISRHRNKFPNTCPISVTKEASCEEGETTIFPLWSCYVKGISVTHVILTFVPTTLRDLKMLSTYDTNSNSSFIVNSEGTERTPSQNSNYSEVPINVTSSLMLPLYIYDCPLSSLVDSYIHNPGGTNNFTKDSYEDHRFKTDTFVQEDSIRLNDQKDDISPEPQSDESDASDHRTNSRQHSKALQLAFFKCFTMSLFSALHYGAYVHHSDVQAAMDQCEESTYEIDITNYLKTICAHFKTCKEPNVTLQYLNQPMPCSELKPLHRLIKDKFFDITNVSFIPIPTFCEYYFCKNLAFEKATMKHDSDDEISNPPSEIIECKSEKEISVSSDCFLNNLTKISDTSINSNMSPLFLHFICTVRHNNEVSNAPVKYLPTCFGELVQYIESSTVALDVEKLQISLDILCLTLPTDVQNVISDYSNKGLRTTSFCSDGFQPSIGSSISEASISSDFKDQETLLYIPELQKSAINTLREEIKWLLKDEIATSLLDIEPVSISSLHFVIKHVSDSISRSSCLLEIIDLNFVYGSSHSYEKFVQEFSKISIPQYKLVKEDELYYLVKSKEVIKVERREILSSVMSSSGYENYTIETTGNFILPDERKYESVEMDGSDLRSNDDVFSRNDDFASQSDISSIQGSVLGTDRGYDEDVSEGDDDYEWLIDLNNKRSNLPNFWLIMQIDQDAVTIYFHCRFLELNTTHVGVYLNVQRAISNAIKDICKRVNQSLLLQSLHDTRNCDHLLEADDSEWSDSNIPSRSTSFTRLKSMDGK